MIRAYFSQCLWIISTAQPIRATSQFSFSNWKQCVVFSGSYAYTAGTSPGTQFVSGRCRSPAWISTGCALCSTPQAQKCLRVQQIEWTHGSTGCVFNTDDYWTEHDIYYGFPDARIGAIRARRLFIQNRQSLMVIEVRLLGNGRTAGKCVVLFQDTQSIWVSKPSWTRFIAREALTSSGGLRGATERRLNGVAGIPEGIDLVANPYLSVDMAVGFDMAR